RPDQERPHDVADQPDGYGHELHVVVAQVELLDDGRHRETDVGDVVEDKEVGDPQDDEVEAGQGPAREPVHAVQQRRTTGRCAELVCRPVGCRAHRAAPPIARRIVDPTGTVQRCKRTPTTMRGWVSSANEYKRVFIIGFQPILEVWAPALPSEQLDTTVDQLSR